MEYLVQALTLVTDKFGQVVNKLMEYYHDERGDVAQLLDRYRQDSVEATNKVLDFYKQEHHAQRVLVELCADYVFTLLNNLLFLVAVFYILSKSIKQSHSFLSNTNMST